MGEARNVVERFYQQFGAGDMTEAFALRSPSASPFRGAEQRAARGGRSAKYAIPDGPHGTDPTIESDGEMYVTGRFRGTHRNDLATPLGTIVA